MGFFKTLFGGQQGSAEEQKRNEEARQFDVLKYDGVKAMRVRQVEHAIRCFEAALQLRDDLEVRDYLSQAFIQNSQLAEAQEQLRLLAQAQPDNTDILMRMAHVYFMDEDYDAMATVCQQMLQLQPDNAHAMMMMARACIGQHQPGRAVEVLTAAVEAEPDFGDARLLRATTLLDDGKTDEALADAEWLMQVAPDNEDVLMLKARIERARGENALALEYYNKVIDLNPFLADALRERAALRLLLGDEGGHKEDLKQLAEILSAGNDENIEQKMREAYKNSNPFG